MIHTRHRFCIGQDVQDGAFVLTCACSPTGSERQQVDHLQQLHALVGSLAQMEQTQEERDQMQHALRILEGESDLEEDSD